MRWCYEAGCSDDRLIPRWTALSTLPVGAPMKTGAARSPLAVRRAVLRCRKKGLPG